MKKILAILLSAFACFSFVSISVSAHDSISLLSATPYNKTVTVYISQEPITLNIQASLQVSGGQITSFGQPTASAKAWNSYCTASVTSAKATRVNNSKVMYTIKVKLSGSKSGTGTFTYYFQPGIM